MSQVEDVLYFLLHSRSEQRTHSKTRMPAADVSSIISQAIDVFKPESILLRIEANIVVVGDIHGNVDELIRLFEQNGYPPKTNYLFLGDYVDRGRFGVEVVILLFCLKIRFPNSIYLLRGNHEIEHISKYYGFYDEVISKYSDDLFYSFQKAFHQLPIAAVVNKKTFCVHGGISPQLLELRSFEALRKPINIDYPSVFQDMLWSDPRNNEIDFVSNERGCGICFNNSALTRFLEDNSLQMLIRSHEMCEKGFVYPFDDSKNCITIFSSPNYCGRKNTAAVVHLFNDNSYHTVSIQAGDINSKRKLILPEWLIEYQSNQSSMKLNVESDPEADSVLADMCKIEEISV